jgi:hypothetical protein
MTLVVGRASGRRVAVVSDTQITEHNVRLPIQLGVLKTCMLPGGICVSFSNSPELAGADFTRFYLNYPNGIGFDGVVSFFEQASAQSGNEYLIAFAKTAKLVKIVDGKRVRSIAQTQWIGDQNAYERFREYDSKKRRSVTAGRAVSTVLFADEISLSPASDLYSTMRQVLADPQITTVGGFAYVLSDRVEAFRQSVYCDMLFDWPENCSEDFVLQLEDQIDFGASGENLNYAVAQFSPSYINFNASAFYWLSGKKLFIFSCKGKEPVCNCSVINNVKPTEVRKTLDEFFGYDFGWLISIMSASAYATKTSFRTEPILTGPNGSKLTMFVHADTYLNYASE